MKIQATVIRDGSPIRVGAEQLVVGDLIRLEPGDKVPADFRLLAVHELQVDESTLTGESLPVSKTAVVLDDSLALADRKNMCFAGSLTTRGTAEGLVVATADSTEVGRISQMISSAQEIATPLTRKIAAFSHMLLWVILAVAALAFTVGVARGHPPAEMFMTAVAIAVGAIPEGLPAAVTIMLAVGVSRMAARKAIIRKLPAVEALGSTTVICSDKTGTLTQNQMTVRAACMGGQEFGFTGSGYHPTGDVRDQENQATQWELPGLASLLACGALCNDAAVLEQDGSWEAHGDPTEAALVVAAGKLKGAPQPTALREALPRVDVIPFESDRMYMATLHARAGVPGAPGVVYVKGSVERLCAMCSLQLSPTGAAQPFDRNSALESAAALSKRGLRVLAFASTEVKITETQLLQQSMLESGLTWLGVQGMLDPPRAEAINAVAVCQRAGIQVKMITGDHVLTASSIARMIGIHGSGSESGGALNGADVAALSDADLPAVAERTAVFARMTPEQKLRLVRALQSRGHVVAMTGDGVNDAPALRQADIGVAMGVSGTEVAKDAADMVLADDNFATIEAAVEEGRSVYSSLTKFIVWTLPTNGGEAFVIVAATMLGWPLPILPVQALYINMVTAILLGMPLIFEAKDAGIMSRPPRDPDRPLLTFELFMRTGLVSLLLCAGSMSMFQWEIGRGMGDAVARTAAVSVIVVGECFYLLSARTLSRPFWAVSLLSNKWLWVGIGSMLAVQVLFVHAPLFHRLFHTGSLDAQAWVRVFLAGAGLFIIVEVEKAIRRALGTTRAWDTA
jgi:magnesium-transporting ATPase (P-type)